MATLENRPNAALLVVDVQNGVVAGAHQRDAVVANIGSLVEKARRERVPVVWVQHSDDDLAIDSHDWRIVPELTAGDAEPLVAKNYGDAFGDTTLEAVLSGLGERTPTCGDEGGQFLSPRRRAGTPAPGLSVANRGNSRARRDGGTDRPRRTPPGRSGGDARATPSSRPATPSAAGPGLTGVGMPRAAPAVVAVIRDSFWPVPTAFAIGAVLSATGLSMLELRLILPIDGFLPSGPAGARSLLSSIITAMISFTALVFSITVVALQLAASQYSPRVLRTFLQDRIIQVTLGTFVATFLFAMVVLAALPSRSDARLPELSLAVSMALVLGSSGMFIYYLDHMTTVVRVSHIIAAIGVQTRRSIDRHGPAPADAPAPPPTGEIVQIIPNPNLGMITHVDLDRLALLAGQHDCAISVLPTPGDFVTAGATLLAIHRTGDTPPRRLDPDRAIQMIGFSVERTPGQDIGFGFRQLADIAERALSSGVNDLTTAVRALQEGHDLLRRVVDRPDAPHSRHDGRGTVRAFARRQSVDSFLAVMIDDVRVAGGDQPRIARLVEAILADLATVALPEHRPAIRRRRGSASN